MPDKLFEKDLVNYCAANVVEYLKLVAVEGDGRPGYELWVKGSWSKQELLLITHNHREPRIWASLDRAVKHFRERYNYKGKIILLI